MQEVTSPELVFLDLETTGFDWKKQDVLEVAAIRVNRLMVSYAAVSTRVLPRNVDRPENARQQALEMAQYDPMVWRREAVSLREAMEALQRITTGAIPVGHNIKRFDMNWLEVARERTGVDLKFVPGRIIDTMIMAQHLKESGKVKSLKLGALCEYLGIPIVGVHRALPDTKMTIKLYKKLKDYGL